MTDPLAALLEELLPGLIYHYGAASPSLPFALAERLRARGVTLAAAPPAIDPTPTVAPDLLAAHDRIVREQEQARIRAGVEALPYSFAQYRCWDDHEDSPHGELHADGSSCPDANGPVSVGLSRAAVLAIIDRSEP